MNLTAFAHIKQWHLRHRDKHPVECHLWDAMLTLWMVGWVGWLPAAAFQAIWAAPLCLLGMSAPTLYVAWRIKAHRARRLRCDWLAVVDTRR